MCVTDELERSWKEAVVAESSCETQSMNGSVERNEENPQS
jgi:hypothetical protein